MAADPRAEKAREWREYFEQNCAVTREWDGEEIKEPWGLVDLDLLSHYIANRLADWRSPDECWELVKAKDAAQQDVTYWKGRFNEVAQRLAAAVEREKRLAEAARQYMTTHFCSDPCELDAALRKALEEFER